MFVDGAAIAAQHFIDHREETIQHGMGFFRVHAAGQPRETGNVREQGAYLTARGIGDIVFVLSR